MTDSMFAPANRLNENWHIESPANGEKYPRLIFSINITTNWKWFILDHEAKIIFERFEDTDAILEIPCAPLKRLIDRDEKDISFYISLTPQIYNDIETFRDGEELKVHLLINKLYLLHFG